MMIMDTTSCVIALIRLVDYPVHGSNLAGCQRVGTEKNDDDRGHFRFSGVHVYQSHNVKTTVELVFTTVRTASSVRL